MQVIQSSGQPATATATAVMAKPNINLSNLWRGVNSVVMGAGPAHALYFATYEYMKDKLAADDGNNHTLAFLASGACATFAHEALMTPFDGTVLPVMRFFFMCLTNDHRFLVIKQRMQLRESTYKNVRECARTVFAKEGITAFYVSLPTTLTMSVPFQSIQFATYEYSRRLLNPTGQYDPKTHVLAGAIAGAFASSVTTPLDVCKTLLQTRGQSSDPRIRNASGLLDAMAIIKQRYGFRGFFRGYKPRVLTNMPSTAISWSVYEYFKWLFEKTDFAGAVGQQEKSLISL